MGNNKRIIFILCSTELGGAENQAMLLANVIKTNSIYEIIFIFLADGTGTLPDKLQNLDIKYHIIKWPSSKYFGVKIFRLLRFSMYLKKLRPTILMPYTTFPNIFTSFVWRFTGAKLCIWNQRDEGIALFADWFTRKAVSNASAYIANSVSAKSFLVDKFKIPEKKIFVIHNGIKLGILTNRYEWRREHFFEANDVLICMVSNLTRYKDHETLLRSFEIVRSKYMEKPVKLLLAGRFDDNYEFLLNLAKEINISESVYFLGKIDDIGSLLNAIDLSVLSSYSEGLPNVILESMYVGVPLTGSKINGIIEAVGNAYGEYLAIPGDHKDLAEKILFLLNNPSITLNLTTANKNRAISQFSVESLYQFTLNAINSSN